MFVAQSACHFGYPTKKDIYIVHERRVFSVNERRELPLNQTGSLPVPNLVINTREVYNYYQHAFSLNPPLQDTAVVFHTDTFEKLDTDDLKYIKQICDDIYSWL